MLRRIAYAGRRPAAASRGRSLAATLGALAVIVLALFLASCGFSSPGNSTGGTPESGRYAYLYSGIDYPLQIAVASGDTVTLTLSPNSNLVATAPGHGQGKATAQPIPLPTDLAAYRDIAATASATASGPIVWQLTSAPRQSLLTPGLPSAPRSYRDVNFQWHVQAIAAGQNLTRVILHLYYVYLDGSEHPGTIVVDQDPIPMVAVAAAPAVSQVSQFKTPLIGLTGLAGALGILRFCWELAQNAKDAKEMADTAVKAAGKGQTRVTQRGASGTSGTSGKPDAS